MNKNIHKRPGHKPKKTYTRPVRDKVITDCLSENRRPTGKEITDISCEAHALAKAGYYLLSMLDEDRSILEDYFPEPEETKSDGSIVGRDLGM